jgi:hypothetical protein
MKTKRNILKSKVIQHLNSLSNKEAIIYFGQEYYTIDKLIEEVLNETYVGKSYIDGYVNAINFLNN